MNPQQRYNDPNRPIKEKVMDWLSQQGVSTVLLAAILVVLGWLGYFGMTTAVPAHLRQIQEGYEKIQKDYALSQKELLERMRDDRMRDREWAGMEREKDRAEWVRIVTRHLEKESKATKDGT